MGDGIIELRKKVVMSRRQAIIAGAGLLSAPYLASCDKSSLTAAREIIKGASGFVVAVLDWFIGQDKTRTEIAAGNMQLAEFGLKNPNSYAPTAGKMQADLWHTKEYKDAQAMYAAWMNGEKVMSTRRTQFVGSEVTQVDPIPPLSAVGYETIMHGKIEDPGYYLIKYETDLGGYAGVKGRPNVVIIRA